MQRAPPAFRILSRTFRYRSVAKKEEVPVGAERSGRFVKFEPMQEKVSRKKTWLICGG
jgi:hypothetical protein